MTFLKSARAAPTLAYSTLALIWLYTFYVSVLTPPFFGYFTVDENFIADSGVFLWYGSTPRCLDWPATPSLLTFFILFGISILHQVATGLPQLHGVMDVFEQFDVKAWEYLADREGFLLVGRTIQLLEVGVVMVLLVRFLYRAQHPLLTPVSRSVLALVIITSYVVWFNAPVLRPEALSGSLFLYVLARLVFAERLTLRATYLLAALFGVILAERLLFVFVAPILVGGIYFLSEKNRISATLRGMALTVGVFMVLCPFILSDPLVVLKSFVGGILAKMNDKPMQTVFNGEFIRHYFQNPVNYLVVAAGGAGVWVLLRERKHFYIVLVANWLFFLFLVLRSAKIYDTHVLPAGLLLLLAVGLGITFVSEKVGRRGPWVAVALTLLVAFSNLYEYLQFQKRSHTVSNIESAYHWLHKLPGTPRLLVHPELEFYLPKTNEILVREWEQNRDTLKMARKLNYILGVRGEAFDGSQPLPLVAGSFAFEDERLYEIQYQLLIKYNDRSPVKKFNYEVYLENTELASHSVPTGEAIKDFRQGRYDYMVTEIQLEGLEPVRMFSNDLHEPIYCYASPQGGVK